MSHRDEGLAALRAGDARTAVERLQQAVREASDGQSWAGLGVALCQLGRPEEGVRALQQAIALAPQQAPLHFNLGRALELQGRAADALKAYQRTASLDPAHQPAQDAVLRLSAPAAPTAAAPTAPSPPLPTAPAVSVPPPPPPAAPALPSEFILTPTPVPPSVPQAPGWAHGTPKPPPPPTMGGYAAAPRPSTVPPPLPPVGYPGAPAAIGAPGGVPLPKPVPVSSGFPWVAVILGVFGVVCAGVVVLAAVLLPVFQKARQAAIRARQRTVAANGGPSNPWPNAAEEADGTPPFGVSGSVPGIRPASAGPDMNSTAPGPKISDRRDAFSVTLPVGFRSALPMPGMLPLGMAGMGRTASYNSQTGSLECQVLCLTFPPSQFDLLTPAETFGRIRDRLPSSLHARLARTQQGSFAGNPSEDDRMVGGMAGQHFIRSRMIWAKPRILLLLFSSPREGDLDSPAANRYFESLEVGSGVDIGGLSEPVKIPEPRFTAPPPMPTLPAPRFVPPPTPHFTPPATPPFGAPNGAYSPGSSPGDTDPNSTSPGGRRFGPRFGPRFAPRFPQPPFGPRAGAPGTAPDSGSGGPSGSPEGPPATGSQ